jgi:hypothetical protein
MIDLFVDLKFVIVECYSNNKMGRIFGRTLRDAEKGCDLAFFSVVASSPNLSTFITVQKYINYFE